MRKLILATAILAWASSAQALLLPLAGNLNLGIAPEPSVTRIRGVGAVVASALSSTGDAHAPAANTAAVVTYSVVPGRHCIGGVAYSYSGTPTGGNLLIENGAGTTVFTQDITAAGPGVVYFDVAKEGSFGTAMIVTLAAGGGGVTGKVSVLSHWVENP
jgi:hypothetical protein